MHLTHDITSDAQFLRSLFLVSVFSANWSHYSMVLYL